MRFCFILTFISFAFFCQAKLANALLWKISHPDLEQTSYLMGTIHTSDEKVFELFNTYKDETFENCELIALEIELDTNPFQALMSFMVTDADYKIENFLSPSEKEKLSNWLKKEHGMKLAHFERIKPIFFYFLVNDFGPASNNKMFLDQYIFELAKEKEKKIMGLESISDQINAFDNIPYEDQFDLLLSSLDQNKKGDKTYQKLVKTYERQKISKMKKLLFKEMPASFRTALVDQRNDDMFQTALPYIIEESVFIAIGAGHLPGEKGLIQLLRDKGFQVEPLSN